MGISERSQAFMVWWALGFALAFGLAFGFLMHMIPPPDAALSPAAVVQWYAERAGQIRLGATITCFTGGFALPLWVVLAIQIARQERGRPVWAVTTALGGAFISLALSLPTIFLGVAAYSTERAPDVTDLMHSLAVMTFVTDVQWNPFAFIPVTVVCFLPQSAPHTPFPRWYGYFTLWSAIMFEAGPLAFNFRSGPFAWNGLLVFWCPLVLFSAWIAVTAYLLLGALTKQRADAEAAA
jgi:hypothetical protein